MKRNARAVTTTRTVQIVALVALVGVLVSAAVLVPVPAAIDPTALREWLAGLGPLAPVAYVGVQATQVLIAPIPGQVVAFVGGYLFGPVWGTALSLLGGAIGTALAVGIVRQVGRPFVERSVPTATLDRYDSLLDRRGRVTLFVLFVLPGLPDDVLCLLAGLTRIPVSHIVAIAVVGRLPGYLLLAIAGSRAARADYGGAAVLAGVLAVGAVLVAWRRRAILAWLSGDPVQRV
ncbi:TVP38/TMEM64 family protein [Halococcoides cellulosivorans]|uniref:TVP38/TMEM64 family protein n=1 Tax=Halococcoides cellulosivorans TaxID=1679096 RepID=UPI00131F45ED|nr:TVP38/TMEM64 family protein [Halococcoides cellulosivorans]